MFFFSLLSYNKHTVHVKGMTVFQSPGLHMCLIIISCLLWPMFLLEGGVKKLWRLFPYSNLGLNIRMGVCSLNICRAIHSVRVNL